MTHDNKSRSGLYLIAACLVALAFYWISMIVFKCFGDSGSRALLFCCGAGMVVSMVVCIVALVFYVAFCLRVWRSPNKANWRLLAIGSVLLAAAISSVLFYS
jgi:hypothetical protein